MFQNQPQILVSFLTVLALERAMRGHERTAGLALAVAAAIKVYPVLLKSKAADLRVLDELYGAGRLRVVVAARFPLERLAEAWQQSQGGRTAGKIIIDVA